MNLAYVRNGKKAMGTIRCGRKGFKDARRGQILQIASCRQGFGFSLGEIASHGRVISKGMARLDDNRTLVAL